MYPKTKKEEKKNISENPDDQNNGETDSVASSNSYTIEGPMNRPMKRTSIVGRMESHCSEDVLLDSTDMDHIDDVIPMTAQRSVKWMIMTTRLGRNIMMEILKLKLYL